MGYAVTLALGVYQSKEFYYVVVGREVDKIKEALSSSVTARVGFLCFT